MCKINVILFATYNYFSMQILTSAREVFMVVIIIVVMFPDLTSVHVKEDFDSVMTSRRVWVSLLDKLAYNGDILKYCYFISDENNNDDNDNDDDNDNNFIHSYIYSFYISEM